MFSLKMHSALARVSECLWFWPGDASFETCAHSRGCDCKPHSSRHGASEHTIQYDLEIRVGDFCRSSCS